MIFWYIFNPTKISCNRKIAVKQDFANGINYKSLSPGSLSLHFSAVLSIAIPLSQFMLFCHLSE